MNGPQTTPNPTATRRRRVALVVGAVTLATFVAAFAAAGTQSAAGAWPEASRAPLARASAAPESEATAVHVMSGHLRNV